MPPKAAAAARAKPLSVSLTGMVREPPLVRWVMLLYQPAVHVTDAAVLAATPCVRSGAPTMRQDPPAIAGSPPRTSGDWMIGASPSAERARELAGQRVHASGTSMR